MKTKDKILKLLNEHRGDYLSGQEIADMLFVTRAAVWKAIKALQSEGHEIDAVTNKGYRLKITVDAINTPLLEEELSKAGLSYKIYHFESVDSTNDTALSLARESGKGIIVIADTQTKGRGRRGRSFYSPINSGLYMSICVSTKLSPASYTHTTATTAVAVAKAIDNVVFDGENHTQIKWVNDIFLNNKKISGILTEAYSSLEESDESYIVIGIGINIYSPANQFPDDIIKTATAIYTDNIPNCDCIRSQLVKSIVSNINFYSNEKNYDSCLSVYRNKSLLKDCYVRINNYTGNYDYAYVTGISEDYQLMVKYEDGKTSLLSTGEVSVVKY